MSHFFILNYVKYFFIIFSNFYCFRHVVYFAKFPSNFFRTLKTSSNASKTKNKVRCDFVWSKNKVKIPVSNIFFKNAYILSSDICNLLFIYASHRIKLETFSQSLLQNNSQ